MTIEEQLAGDLKDAMRARNSDLVACVRQIKSKVQEVENAPGFAGPKDDAFYQRVIASYVKSLEKGIAELEAGGERTAPLRQRYGAEITYLRRYLPALLSEAETKEKVLAAVAKIGARDARQVGAVVGAVMKEYKGRVDAGLVRRLAEEHLQGSSS